MSMKEAIPQAKRIHILEEVKQEQERQVKKWGIQNHPDYTVLGLLPPSLPVMMNATADNAKYICDVKFKNGKVSWNDIFVEEALEASEEAKLGNTAALREELIQVAAVACSWVDAIDRRGVA